MGNLKHTPGEWLARIDEIGIDIIQTNTGFGITDLGNYDKLRKADYNIETAKANAKLIAAAPDLLKACISALKDVQEINKMLITNGHHGYVLMETELDEVIKKATT